MYNEDFLKHCLNLLGINQTGNTFQKIIFSENLVISVFFLSDDCFQFQSLFKNTDIIATFKFEIIVKLKNCLKIFYTFFNYKYTVHYVVNIKSREGSEFKILIINLMI